MIEAKATAAILLAAGGSTRFGADKLAALLDGETILAHAAAAVATSGFDNRVAVLREPLSEQTRILETLGFKVIFNARASEGLSTSIRAGVEWAEARGFAAAMIALADMPFVTAEHYKTLIAKAHASDAEIAYSRCGARRSPPAIFGARWFSKLRALEGDAGARALLGAASEADGVYATPRLLLDIDSPADFDKVTE